MKFLQRNTTTSEIRRISDLFGRSESSESSESSEKIYIYLANERIGKEFLQNAEEEGFRFGEDGMPSQREWSDILAVTKDKEICYVGFAGRMRFGQRKCDIPRIDYEWYLNGARRFYVVK